MTTFGQNESRPPERVAEFARGFEALAQTDAPVADSATSPAPHNGMPDYIRRLNDVAELVEIATNHSAADGSVGNAYSEILHALAVEIPVMLADDRERLLARTTWLPIETAPKDAVILTFNRGGGYSEVVFWRENLLSGTSRKRAGWTDGTIDHYNDYAESTPTHWMPLPAPPTEDTNAR